MLTQFLRFTSKKDSSVRTVESRAGSENESIDAEWLLPGQYRISEQKDCRWRCLLAALPIATLAFLAGGLLASKAIDLNQTCAEYTNSYSPIMKDIEINYSTIEFNGSLLRENVFRMSAGPEADAAWEALGVNYRAIRVSEAEAAASSLRRHVRISSKYGGGYPANVEGLHHLHCLNLLRKTLYYNFDYYYALGGGPFANGDRILRLHVSHCLDMIRQQLQCQVDTGVLGQVWILPERPEAYADFNTKHRCKNFNVVRRWAEMRQLPSDVPEDFLEPPGEDDLSYSEIP